jgi:hypothetical protein
LVIAGIAYAMTLVDSSAGNPEARSITQPAPPGSVVRIQAETGKAIQTIPHVHPGIAVADAHFAADLLAVGEGAIWMYHFPHVARPTMVVIDPAGGIRDRMTLERSLGAEPGLAVASQTVWFSGSGPQGQVSRLNPATIEPLPPVTVASIAPTASMGTGVTDIALGATNLWVVVADGGLTGLDSLTGRTKARIDLDASPDGIAYADGSVWILDALKGEVIRVDVDRATPKVSAHIQVPGNQTDIAAGNGGIWVLDRVAGTATRIDPETAEPLSPVQVGPTPEAITVGLGSAWVTDRDGRIYPVDSGLGPQDPIDVGGSLGAIAVDEDAGEIWVAVLPEGA